MSEFPRTNRVTKSLLAASAATVLFAGCGSSHHKKNITPRPTLPPAPPTETGSATTPPPAPETLESYLNSSGRNKRIATAVTKFGKIVLLQSEAKGSAWQPFDAYCSTPSTVGTGKDGWVSQGHKPQSGENCELQHNPQYGGKNMGVNVDIMVGSNGSYDPNRIIGAGVTSLADCSADFTYDGKDLGWTVTYDLKKPEFSVGAHNLAAAKKIDNEALACLSASAATLK